MDLLGESARSRSQCIGGGRFAGVQGLRGDGGSLSIGFHGLTRTGLVRLVRLVGNRLASLFRLSLDDIYRDIFGLLKGLRGDFGAPSEKLGGFSLDSIGKVRKEAL